MDHLIPVRRPDLEVIKKKNPICHLMDLAVPVDHRVEIKESKKVDKYLDLARELKAAVEYEGDSDINCC